MELFEKFCVPCEKGSEPLRGEKLEELRGKLDSGWRIEKKIEAKGMDKKKEEEVLFLEKEFLFGDFLGALRMTNQVGELAERENHHPDMHLSWGRLKICLWTHSIGGLSENDFIMACKIDRLTQE